MTICKIGVLFANYGPYHIARTEALYNCLKERNWQVVGIELARSAAEYPWQNKVTSFPFSIVTLITNQQLEQAKISNLLQQLPTVLNEINPDALVIAGYANPAMLSALAWCLLHRKLAILLSDSKEDDTTRSWWREAFKRWIVKRYKVALVAGKPHKRYLVKLGMAPEAIFLGYDVVGNESFHPHKIKHLPKKIDRNYFLSSNRFIPKKNIFFLLSAYSAYRQTVGSDAWDLVLCGDGSLRPQIEQHINELEIKDFVHLPGFLQQDELLPHFAHAKCFIHASIQEQWGLVVNEAMAAGLPVLVSNRCGCFEDLIIEGVNGFGFDPENTQELTNLMVKMSSGAVDLQAMGQASLEQIKKFSPDYFAQSLIQAVEYALTHR